MERPADDVMRHVVEVEAAAEEVLAEKQQLIELDRRRQETRLAVRQLQKDKTTGKTWVCVGDMFLKLPREDALKLLKRDFEALDAEIAEVRVGLKRKVATLRDAEQRDELKGFSLQPLTKTELQAVSDLL